MVSGAATLIWSYNPDMTAKEVKELLINSSKDTVIESKGDKDSYPMLNMTAFLNEHPYYESVTETYLNEFPYYNELIENYYLAVGQRWDTRELSEMDLGPSYHDPQPLPEDYGFELRDINGDGVPELILGIYGTDMINEIYTMQNNEPTNIFKSNLHYYSYIYSNGTIHTYSSERVGSIFGRVYYKLNNDGSKQEFFTYYERADKSGFYEDASDSAHPISTLEIEEINKKHLETDIINHSFTPFVIDWEAVPERKEIEARLSDEEIENLLNNSYQEIEPAVMDVHFKDLPVLFDKYYDYSDGEDMSKNGVNPNHPFYEDVYALIYPNVSDVVSEKGMETLVNQSFSYYWDPASPSSFMAGPNEIDVLINENAFFRVKQTNEIGPQDYGSDPYYETYLIDFIKEEGTWKFAGSEKE